MPKMIVLIIILINNNLLDSLVLSSLLTAIPSPALVLAFTVTLYFEYGAKIERNDATKTFYYTYKMEANPVFRPLTS